MTKRPAKPPAKPTAPFGGERWVKTRAKYLAMLAPFVSTEETRYYLQGIHVERHPTIGILLVATNGQQMGIVHDADGETNGNWICPVEAGTFTAIKRESKALIPTIAVFSGRSNYLYAGEDEKKIRKTRPDELALHSSIAPPIDGTYPEWRRIVPAALSTRQKPIGFNVKYMADFAKVSKAHGFGNHYVGFGFYQTGGESAPVIVMCREIPEFVGVLMPMRLSLPAGLPGWLASVRP